VTLSSYAARCRGFVLLYLPSPGFDSWSAAVQSAEGSDDDDHPDIRGLVAA
jgi:hypothetical protein